MEGKERMYKHLFSLFFLKHTETYTRICYVKVFYEQQKLTQHT